MKPVKHEIIFCLKIIFFEDNCTEAEESTRKGNIDKAYKIVKRIFGERLYRNKAVIDENGNKLNYDEEIDKRWNQKTGKLRKGETLPDDSIEK